ncbi:carbon-nitrogen hydrolase family protein [Lactobacillus murinus]|uniref:carbon-nitrogen hydrolase family protein n=1 Tax=Ligilactobacillus murinus TaxID=1622 RepID=UPI00188454FA|nr:carbon-nitrogen hydrolase family protein [Ligilactobacillus murinus]
MCNQIIKIALAQFDNDLNHINRTMSKIEEIVKKASQKKVDFLVFPELFLTGLNCQIKLEKNYLLICNVLHEYF